MNNLKLSLREFLEEIDKDFTPPLSLKVDLDEFVDKIMDKAELIILNGDKGLIDGLVVLYCNDIVGRKGYISLLGVRKSIRNQGIANRLMIQAINKARESGMQFLGIHSNNPVALHLYKKIGFNKMSGEGREYLELQL